jgi:hypothetical protein
MRRAHGPDVPPAGREVRLQVQQEERRTDAPGRRDDVIELRDRVDQVAGGPQRVVADRAEGVVSHRDQDSGGSRSLVLGHRFYG